MTTFVTSKKNALGCKVDDAVVVAVIVVDVKLVTELCDEDRSIETDDSEEVLSVDEVSVITEVDMVAPEVCEETIVKVDDSMT